MRYLKREKNLSNFEYQTNQRMFFYYFSLKLKKKYLALINIKQKN